MDAVFLLATSLVAQARAEEANRALVEVQSIWDFILKGGLMMIPIGICSLIALAIVAERAISLRRSRVIPRGFLDGINGALAAPGNGRVWALEFCKQHESPVATIFSAALRRLDEPVELLEKHIEQAGARVVFNMRKFLRALSVIASITPLMGLLGTIFGMIRAFQTVATSGEALGKTELLARGIYEAMITTAAGLMVAIPVLICYHWISAKIDRLVGEIDLLTVEFIENHRRGCVNASRAGVTVEPPIRSAPELSSASGAAAVESAAALGS